MDKYDVIIIGAGPAGLTSSIYSCRYGLKTLLIERAMLGGQVINASKIENYPGFPEGINGYELISRIQNQVLKHNVTIVYSEVINVSKDTKDTMFNITTNDHADYICNALIIASGSLYNKLGVSGESEFLGKGVSYCATCDGFIYKDRSVAVVGGGDTALSDAIELSNHVSELYLIHRRDSFRASDILQQQVLNNKKIKILWNTVVEEIQGDNFLRKLKLINLRENKHSFLEVSGLFIAVGTKPNTEIFSKLVKLDENKNIIVDIFMSTSTPGVFAAGDVRAYSPRQIVSAAGDGAIAAINAYKYLKGL